MSLIPRGWGLGSSIVDPWDPFEGFPFNTSLSAFPRPSFPSETSAFVNARIDWKETREAHVFKADLPGLKKEELKVEVEEGNVLQISGERSQEQEDKTDTWHRMERSSGRFVRRFRLPENAKMDQVKVAVENGVATDDARSSESTVGKRRAAELKKSPEQAGPAKSPSTGGGSGEDPPTVKSVIRGLSSELERARVSESVSKRRRKRRREGARQERSVPNSSDRMSYLPGAAKVSFYTGVKVADLVRVCDQSAHADPGMALSVPCPGS